MMDVFSAANDEEALESQALLGSLQIFGLQAWAWANLQNQTSAQPVYMYHFERDLPHTPSQQAYGAFHTGEVPYAYQNLKMSSRPWKDIDYQLSNTMSDYWVNFAKNGNPNGQGLPEWPETSLESFPAMFFGDQTRVGTTPNIPQLEVLYQFTEQQIQTQTN